MVMRFVVLYCWLIVSTFPALALTPNQRAAILTPSAPVPSLDCQFNTGTVIASGTIKAAGNCRTITFTRASAAWYFNSSGQLAQAASGFARLDYGLNGTSPLGVLMEIASTNEALQSRNMTQAVWVAVNMTTAKTATGIDGSANSASVITSSAGNGTLLQALTVTSETQCLTAYVKRVTGTGEVDLTLNGGTGWTNVAPQINSSTYTRVPSSGCLTTTLLNPSIGFRLVTSGDAIDVDVVQLEHSTLATSPIVTTTAAVTRAIENATIASYPNAPVLAGSVAISATLPSAGVAGAYLTSLFDGTTSNFVALQGCNPFLCLGTKNAGSFTQSTTTQSMSVGVLAGLFMTWSPSVMTGGSGSGVSQFASATLPTVSLTTIALNSVSSAATNNSYWMKRYRFWNSALPTSYLITQSQSP